MRLGTTTAAAAAALGALAMGGCAMMPGMGKSTASIATNPQFARVEPGLTARADVMASAGEPDYVVPRHNIAVYVDGPRPGRMTVGCGRDYRFLCGTKHKDAYDMYVIQYNESGVVERAQSMTGDTSYIDLVDWAAHPAAASSAH